MKSIEDLFEKDLKDEIKLLPIKQLKANSVVLMENAYVKNIPILLEGSIKVRKIDESGKEIILYQIYPGESCILSIISCLNDKQCNAEAYVEKTSKIIMVPSSKSFHVMICTMSERYLRAYSSVSLYVAPSLESRYPKESW
jgi:CRP/FNR family transcriptional regulator